MRQIEDYSADDGQLPVDIDGTLIPVPSLIEDDEGFRYLLVGPEPVIPVRTWARAYEGGVCSLVSSDPGGEWLLLPSQKFINDRTELPQRAAFEIPSGWVAYPGALLFTDIIGYFPPELFADDSHTKNEMDAQGEVGGRFVSLHSHSEYSALDGLSHIQEMVDAVVADGQGALAITDHGNCASHPELQSVCDEAGIRPIFGMEAYFQDDRFRRTKSWEEVIDGKKTKVNDSAETRWGYTHISLWAMNDAGLRNLWAMSTESYRDGLFDGKPRLDWDTLTRLNEGVMASTGCLGGPLAEAIKTGDDEKARIVLARLLDIFGDRLYIELHTNSLEEQRKVNERSLVYAQEFGIPLIACTDSHYTSHADAETHNTWLAVNTGKDVTQETGMFGGAPEYFMHTVDEVTKALSYLPFDIVAEAMLNTVTLANRCTARIQGVPTAPVYSKGENAVADDERRLWEIVEANWQRKVIGKEHPEQEYRARVEREMDLLIRKSFCGYFLVVWDYVTAAKREGILVGPGRGSGGGSLVAYLADIVEIDPVDYDLIFERFLTEGRVDLPDFDIDFPASKRDWIKNYLADRWGADHVVTIGTVLRLKAKGAVNNALQALKPTLRTEPDYGDFKLFSDTVDEAEAPLAGKSISWADLWAQFGDILEPMQEKYPTIMDAAQHLVGRVKSYGKHAAGVVISTDRPLTDLPLRAGEDGAMVTQFDMNALQLMGYVKFDLLTLTTLDTVQGTIDLVKERYGRIVNVYDWREEFLDPQVWSEVSAGRTLGLFQIETPSGTRLTKQVKPVSIADLATVMTIVRPGPARSGLTGIYLQRRDGLQDVTYPDPRMESFLSPTLGAMIYQEQILATCMQLAGYSATEAEGVRKILGKKLVEKAAEAGREFIRRAIECGTKPDVAESLWAQMSEFAKYCITGDTQIKLAASGKYSDGAISVEELHSRAYPPLLPNRQGKKAVSFRGPCVTCGEEKPGQYRRGQCSSCDGWWRKFWHQDRGVHALAHDADGRIRPCRILDVIEQGSQSVYTVTLADGKFITATSDHRHLTPSGYRFVRNLTVGDQLITHAGYENLGYVPSRDRLTRGERIGRGYIDGGCQSLEQWTRQASRHCEHCGHDGSLYRLERAHLDGVRNNNNWSNLAMLCVSCHKSYDNRFNNPAIAWGKGHLSAAVEIVSIDYAGEQQTYDVVMDAPHNFVANGIVTHNSFGKAHAYGYAVTGYYTSWLKFHFPAEFLTSVLSEVKDARVPDFVQEAHRMGFRVFPPDVNLSKEKFTSSSMGVRYGISSVKGISSAAAHVVAGQPYASLDDFLDRAVTPTGSKVNMGHVKSLVAVGAFDSLHSNRRGLEQRLEFETSGEAAACVHKDIEANGPGGLPCRFDWKHEPDPPMVKILKRDQKPCDACLGTGKTLGVNGPEGATEYECPACSGTGTITQAPKPPPKRCTVACRNYTAPERFDIDRVVPYTRDDIIERERELLGAYLSGSPFDRIDPKDLELAHKASDVERGPVGEYLSIALLSKAKPWKDRNGNTMAFLSFYAQDGEVDVTCFASDYQRYAKDLRAIDGLFIVVLRKNDRGCTLVGLAPA